MPAETLIVEATPEQAQRIREYAEALGARVEPWNLALGKYGYLRLNEPYDNAGLCRAAAQALGISPPDWSGLSPQQQRELAELGVDDSSFMNEGRFEPEQEPALRLILNSPA